MSVRTARVEVVGLPLHVGDVATVGPDARGKIVEARQRLAVLQQRTRQTVPSGKTITRLHLTQLFYPPFVGVRFAYPNLCGLNQFQNDSIWRFGVIMLRLPKKERKTLCLYLPVNKESICCYTIGRCFKAGFRLVIF